MRKDLFPRFPEGRAKALTFSYDDGNVQDRRLIELLDRHGMKGTFNINSGLFRREDQAKSNRLTEREALDLFGNGNHEVAVHALNHPFLDCLPMATVTQEIVDDRRNIERMFGKITRGMAYPYGTSVATETVMSALKSCGIVYSRTTESTEKFDLPTNWLRWPATCKHTCPRLSELAQQFLALTVKDRPKLFYLWGHTYEFDNDNNWDVIEKFIADMAGKEDTVWYATNIEIYEYMEDFNRLLFSVDCGFVKNPTCRKLWFQFNKELYSIEPGKTLSLVKTEK